ncbi:MAG: YicC family protein [Planctomycetota bacterium]|nr:MAG: YicC family protein [Planctomycetota bacterium]
MTGYGRAERRASRVGASVEVRSVNGKHLQLRVRAASEWLRLEPRIESTVRAMVRRGAVDVFVRLDVASGGRMPRVDTEVLAVYRRALKDMGDEGGGAELLRLPGVVTLSEPELNERAVERAVIGALKDALDGLDSSRLAEGARLRKVLERELKGLRRELVGVQRRAPKLAREAKSAMQRRLAELLDDRQLPLNDPTLLREVAQLADRVEVHEELDRLACHLDALTELLDAEGPVGRKLDFLLQEVGREINTLGSKVADVEVTTRVVSMKACVERLREQAANLE